MSSGPRVLAELSALGHMVRVLSQGGRIWIELAGPEDDPDLTPDPDGGVPLPELDEAA